MTRRKSPEEEDQEEWIPVEPMVPERIPEEEPALPAKEPVREPEKKPVGV